MNLKKATDLLIAGLIYTVLHKIIMFLFGSSLSDLMLIIYSIIWLAAAGTIILFCFYFLKEVDTENRMVQLSLKSVIVFVSLIIIWRFPFNILPSIYKVGYLLYDLSRLFVVLSLFLFLLNFFKDLSPEYSELKTPALILIFGFGINTLFGLITNYHYLQFLISGSSVEPIDIFAPIANVAGLITLIAEFYFLLKFRKVKNFKNLLLQK